MNVKKRLRELERKIDLIIDQLNIVDRQTRRPPPLPPLPTESPWIPDHQKQSRIVWDGPVWDGTGTVKVPDNVWDGWQVFTVDDDGNIEPVRH